jgi:hypothetical protein
VPIRLAILTISDAGQRDYCTQTGKNWRSSPAHVSENGHLGFPS